MMNWTAVLKNRITDSSISVSGLEIHIPSGVMNPILFKTGFWFAACMREQWKAEEKLLDLGCGVGLLGCFGQLDGLKVTASDLNPKACLAAKKNGIKDVRQGDLLDPVLGVVFDHICFNPPYYKDLRWYTPFKKALHGSKELIKDLLKKTPEFLTPTGQLWMSTGKGAEWLWPTLEANCVVVHKEQFKGEEMMLWKMTKQH